MRYESQITENFLKTEKTRDNKKKDSSVERGDPRQESGCVFCVLFCLWMCHCFLLTYCQQNHQKGAL